MCNLLFYAEKMEHYERKIEENKKMGFICVKIFNFIKIVV
jgi:hypothetical protein